MPPLTIGQILNAMYQALFAWDKNNGIGATVSIARDPFHVLELLAASPGTWRLILHWAGDDNISDIDALPLTENVLEVILSFNLGLTARPDLALISGPQGRPSVLDQIDGLRGFILGVLYPNLQTGVYAVYAGTKPFVTPEGIPLAAYVMTFKLKAAVNVTPISTPIG